MTAADVLVESLMDWGVEVIFGLPGDGINGIMEALRTAQDKIRFMQVRHEESAAFMACGYAKYHRQTGRAVSPPPDPAAFTCSMAYMTPRWMASRCSRSPDCSFTI